MLFWGDTFPTLSFINTLVNHHGGHISSIFIPYMKITTKKKIWNHLLFSSFQMIFCSQYHCFGDSWEKKSLFSNLLTSYLYKFGYQNAGESELA